MQNRAAGKELVGFSNIRQKTDDFGRKNAFYKIFKNYGKYASNLIALTELLSFKTVFFLVSWDFFKRNKRTCSEFI